MQIDITWIHKAKNTVLFAKLYFIKGSLVSSVQKRNIHVQCWTAYTFLDLVLRNIFLKLYDNIHMDIKAS